MKEETLKVINQKIVELLNSKDIMDFKRAVELIEAVNKK